MIYSMLDNDRSEEERAVATMSYVPPMFVLFLFWKHWRVNYFTRYHMFHAFLIGLLGIGLIVLAIWGSIYVSALTQFQFSMMMLTSMFITFSILTTVILSFYCAYQASKGLFVVLPILTNIYYLLLERSWGTRALSYQKPLIPMNPRQPRRKTK